MMKMIVKLRDKVNCQIDNHPVRIAVVSAGSGLVLALFIILALRSHPY